MAGVLAGIEMSYCLLCRAATYSGNVLALTVTSRVMPISFRALARAWATLLEPVCASALTVKPPP